MGPRGELRVHVVLREPWLSFEAGGRQAGIQLVCVVRVCVALPQICGGRG